MAKSLNEVPLGSIVVHAVSKQAGVVTGHLTYVTGNQRVVMEQLGKTAGDIASDAWPFVVADIQIIDMADDQTGSLADRVTPITETTPIPLGSQVRDVVTGMEGIAIIRTVSLNGCVQYAVQIKGKPNELPPEAIYVDHTQLEVSNAGVIDHIQRKDTSTGCSTGTMRGVRPSMATRPR